MTRLNLLGNEAREGGTDVDSQRDAGFLAREVAEAKQR